MVDSSLARRKYGAHDIDIYKHIFRFFVMLDVYFFTEIQNFIFSSYVHIFVESMIYDDTHDMVDIILLSNSGNHLQFFLYQKIKK